MSPEDLVWGLPGQPWQWTPFTAEERKLVASYGLNPDLIEGKGAEAAVEREQLRAISLGLANGEKGERLLGLAGAPVLRLSPPRARPRLMVALRWRGSGSSFLYLVEQGEHQRITRFPAQMAEARDLTGDGRPEIIAAAMWGSGAVLALQILAWDDRGVRELFDYSGAMEPGNFGFFDAEGDGERELWIDTATTKGLFAAEPYAHRPFLRDRLVFRLKEGRYRQYGRFRFATPFYHLNRYLWLMARFENASAHVELGARIDAALARQIGVGPFRGGNDLPFVNGRMWFCKGQESFYADFGATGRLLALGRERAPAPFDCLRTPSLSQAFAPQAPGAWWEEADRAKALPEMISAARAACGQPGRRNVVVPPDVPALEREFIRAVSPLIRASLAGAYGYDVPFWKERVVSVQFLKRAPDVLRATVVVETYQGAHNPLGVDMLEFQRVPGPSLYVARVVRNVDPQERRPDRKGDR